MTDKNRPIVFGALQPHALGALARQGMRAYFESPTAYAALLVFYLSTGYLFAAPLFLAGQASIKGLIDFGSLLLAFIIPALTMGLLAEEMKTGTFESLATLPLGDWDIVIGKYLGFAGTHAAAVAGLLVYPLVLSFIAQPPAGLDWGETAGVLTAFLALGLMFGAIGLFASSLGKNQIVAFTASFFICFMLFAAGKLAAFAPGALTGLADFIGIDSHIDNLAKGVFDSRDFLYFASVSYSFLYMTVARLETRRL